MLKQRLFVACFVALIALVTQTNAAVPVLEAYGENLNVIVEGSFRVNGDAVALSQDITNAIASLRTDIITSIVAPIDQRVTQLQTDSATKTALNTLEQNAASKGDLDNLASTITTSLANFDFDLDHLATSVNTSLAILNSGAQSQTEVTDALLSRTTQSFGWKGAAVVGDCTAQTCDVAIFGKGFFPSGPYMYNDMNVNIGEHFIYKVTVTVENTIDPIECNVTNVEPNFVFCNCVIADPPAQRFWTNLELFEDDIIVPFSGGAMEPDKVLSFTTSGPTITTNSKDFSFTFADGEAMVTPSIAAMIDSHDPATTTTAFTSSDQSIVKNNDIKTTKTATGVNMILTYTNPGTVTITMTVTNEFNSKATHTIRVALKTRYVCSSIAKLSATSCVQDPIDPHWGRGSSNCMKLQDGNIGWSPQGGLHIGRAEGSHFTLTFSEKTLYTVKISQFGSGYAHTGFQVFVLDADSQSPFKGSWINIGTCGAGDCDITSTQGVSTHQLADKDRRVAGVKFVATAGNKFDWFRLMEVQMFGCD